MIRFFMPESATEPADLARIEFNLFLRFVTTPLIVILLILCAAGMAAEGIVSERTRETWGSLIATPLPHATSCAARCWRASGGCACYLATLLVLWTIGLVAGAIHPPGFLVSLLVAAAWTWLMLVSGCRRRSARKTGTTPQIGPAPHVLAHRTGIVPFLLPAR